MAQRGWPVFLAALLVRLVAAASTATLSQLETGVGTSLNLSPGPRRPGARPDNRHPVAPMQWGMSLTGVSRQVTRWRKTRWLFGVATTLAVVTGCVLGVVPGPPSDTAATASTHYDASSHIYDCVADGVIPQGGCGPRRDPFTSASETANARAASITSVWLAAKTAGRVDSLLTSIATEGRTAGVLDLDGELIPLVSGKGSMGNYAASGHVEGQAALIMRERGAASGTLYIDNPNGICGYCTSQVPTLLPRGAVLDVRTPAGTVPPSVRWGNSRTFVGNDADPKPWPR